MRLSLSNFWLNVILSTALLGAHNGAVSTAQSTPSQAPAEANVPVRRTDYREVDKEPHVSGCRIEPLDSSTGETPFLGYTSRGVSMVRPDEDVRVVLFGFWLDELNAVSFVPAPQGSSANCSAADSSMIFEQTEFVIQTDKRMVVTVSFPRTVKNGAYHICTQRRRHSSFIEVSDSRTWISTEVPPRVYYFPLYLQIAIVSFLLVLSGLFSGLNLGLMSLTPQELMLIQKSGSKTERRYAEAILPVRQRGNLLLCSLLIGNVLVNSGISILLDDMTSGYVALIGASAGIVVFGEIFPQSLCVKKGLAVGAKTIWVTRFFMILTFPIAWPISKLLDCILGEEVQSYDRKRLMELIKMSSSEGLQEELKIAVGAMEISDKTVSDVMTRIHDVFMLPDTTVLNTRAVAEILRMGYTRIPVYSGDRNTVVSLLFVKDLALLDPDDNFTIQTVCNYHQHPLRFIMEDTPLRVMLEEFKKGDYHLAMVQRITDHNDKDPSYDLVGVVTLEDIVEEILQAEIVDETDAIMDNVNRTRRRGAQARDVVCIMDSDEPARVISVQMQMVTMQWLTTNQRAFDTHMISQPVLEKLVRQHCRRVELTHLPEMYDRNAGIPRNAKLYTKQEYSDRFILILEGRALVTIGQDQMTFEAGPWHAFGTEMLERLVQRCEASKDKDDQQSHSRSSINGAGDIGKNAKLGFTPDYSVVVRDDCTFLEITANSWLLAYKTTLISRGGNRPSLVDIDHPSPMRSLSRTSLDDRKTLVVHPQVDAVRRNGKGRSCSESEHMELLPRLQQNGSPLSDRSVLSQI